MNLKKLLLISDYPSTGKVALNASTPIISAMGYSPFNLPTALISNTFNYGKTELLDLSYYMKNTLGVWKDLGFSFDGIYVGYINCNKQVDIIIDAIQRENKPLVLLDPIMGDHGKLYSSLSNQHVEQLRRLLPYTDVITPNLTEALLLIGENEPLSLSIDIDKIEMVASKLRSLGAKSIVISSCLSSDNNHYIYVYDHLQHQSFTIFYEQLPLNYPGTGDIFATVLFGNLINKVSINDAAKRASNFVTHLLHHSNPPFDNKEGLPIEKHLNILNQFI